MNPHWSRWVNSSIAKHFHDIIAGALPLYIEGEDRQTETQEDYCELRFDGPDGNPLSPKLWKLTVTIDALIVSHANDKNIYTLDVNIGLVSSAFTKAITVYKYGDGPDDSPDPNSPLVLGCLKLLPNPSTDRIIVSRFGQSVPGIKIRQATVEAGYEMLLEV